MTIAIFGLGYVGAVTAGCLTAAGHRCIGVDVQQDKIDTVNAGRAPIIEPGLEGLFESAHRSNLLSATTDAAQAVREADASLVCVGTPSTANGTLDLRFVEEVVRSVAATLRESPIPHALILRSTMLPGSTRRLVSRHAQDLVDSGRLQVFFYPEFLREGSAIADFREPSLAVAGSVDGGAPPAGLDVVLGQAVAAVRWEEAELIKYACNAFHAAKVAFANEIGRLAKLSGIDSRRVMDLLCSDTRLNTSSYYLRPGNPFGGSCLPKDLRALNHLGRSEGLDLPMLASLLPSNRAHLESLLSLIERCGRGPVAILGLSFKSDTDDLRESCMVDVAQHLLGVGRELRIYDPQLNLARLLGSNKRVVDVRLPHLARLLADDLSAAISDSSVLVVSQRCAPIEALHPLLTPSHTVIDVNGWPELATLPARYEGFCW
jgi:GDP-mannose 6-dehydrogenase